MPKSSPLRYEHAVHAESTFLDTSLAGSSFNDVNLRNSTFENVALPGANFRNVCFGGACIDDANLVGLKINGVLVTDLQRAYAESQTK